MRIILDIQSDSDGNIWLDATQPFGIFAEKSFPHRLAIRTTVENAPSPSTPIWLRLERPQIYHLIDLLQQGLDEATRGGAEPITKTAIVTSPLQGGVNTATGNPILVFEGKYGLQHRLELPYDQTGFTMKILEDAARTAANHRSAVEQDQKVQIRPREVKSIHVYKTPDPKKPAISITLTNDLEFSFLLDQKIYEEIRKGPKKKTTVWTQGLSPYVTVAEDIEYFREHWCNLYEPPADDELRRGSAALRRLLVEGYLHKAWRNCGFPNQPCIMGPDLDGLLAEDNIDVSMVIHFIAGGATINGCEYAFQGLIRIDNPSTGVPANAEEGFAIQSFYMGRDARNGEGSGAINAQLGKRKWKLTSYLQAPCAISFGRKFSRLDLIKYFANYSGGVHLDKAKSTAEKSDYTLLEQLNQKIKTDTMDGLAYSLLSIGQAIGSSSDMLHLAQTIQNSVTAISNKSAPEL